MTRFSNPLNDCQPSPADDERRDAAAEDKADEARLDASIERSMSIARQQAIAWDGLLKQVFGQKKP